MYCAECGSQLAAGERFCGECGAAVSAPEPAPASRPSAAEIPAVVVARVASAPARGDGVGTLNPVRRRQLLVVAAIAAVVALAAGWYFSRPELHVFNSLIDSVRVEHDGKALLTLAPGQRYSQQLGPFGGGVVRWTIVRPMLAGQPLGDDFHGDTPASGFGGTVAVVADPWSGAGKMFTALLSNDSGRLLTVTVNDGLGDANTCQCQIAPGQEKVHLGYYRLNDSSTVRVADAAGRSATYGDLAQRMDKVARVFVFSVGPDDLR